MDKKNKSLAAQSIIEADKVTQRIAENTKNSLHDLLAEEVKKYMKQSILTEAEDDKEDEIEISDVVDDTENGDETKEVDTEIGITTDDDTESSDLDIETDIEDVENGDEWADFEQYKIADGEYDFSDVKDDNEIVKVYKLLNNDDGVIIKQDGNKIGIKDNETGAEYVIDVDPDNTEMEDDEIDFDTESDDLEDDDNVFEVNVRRLGKLVNENDNMGYTDNYQKNDVITNLGMTEPAKNKVDADKGVPKGNQKPWAGKNLGKPFDEVVTECDDPMNECDEIEIDEITSITSNNARKVPKTHSPETREPHLPYGSKHISVAGKYKENIPEAVLRKLKKVQEENEQLKSALPKLKTALEEAALVNVKLGQIVKLISENTVTKEEKLEIVNRFVTEAKTIKESKALYESINRELNKKANSGVVLEKQFTVNGSKQINETTVYQSDEVMKTLGLMKRMEGLK